MRYLIITVDTEGDNLWSWKEGAPISTENSAYIPRFQELCEEYGMIPTYLTNYEMAKDPRWTAYGKRKALEGKCEIGMHLHAWNTPPEYPLTNRYGGNSYITEYPEEVIRQKVGTMAELLSQSFETPVTSNRSGRWATNRAYFKALAEHGIKVDCSVTPGLDLSGLPGRSVRCGNDYRGEALRVYEVYPGLLEVPMTTARTRWETGGGVKRFLKTALKGKDLWLRPIPKSAESMLQLSRTALKRVDYLELMLHSSELMPGGSPYFRTEEDVEGLYAVLRRYFGEMRASGIRGISLSEYARIHGETT